MRIEGFGLRETTHVKFGGAAVVPDRVADNEVVATAPAAGPGPVRVWPATPDVPDPPDPGRHLMSQKNLDSIFTYAPATAPCVPAPPPPPGGSPSQGTHDSLPQPGSNRTMDNQITPRAPGSPIGGGGSTTPASLISSQSSPAAPLPGGSAQPPVIAPQPLGAQPAPGGQSPSLSVQPGASAAPSQAAAGAEAERREVPVPAPKFFFVPQEDRAPEPAWAAGMALLVCGIAVLFGKARSTGAGRIEEGCRPAPRFAL